MSTLLFIAALLSALGGCIALALSQQRHWEAVMGCTAVPRRWLRAAGWSLIAASLAAVVARDGVSFGILVWPMVIGVAALATAATLSWRPRLLRPLASCIAA
ncbi:MAG: DUF3325 domain-containing protein [Porphyrobacter sp.]|jgi:hypothetical protein|nr:DUF3325 domain-containing protein [Porphyrobacter sp.]